MDFMEQLFGSSPGGGSGAFEALLVLLLSVLIALAVAAVWHGRRARHRQ